jgi:hypothetical protein
VINDEGLMVVGMMVGVMMAEEGLFLSRRARSNGISLVALHFFASTPVRCIHHHVVCFTGRCPICEPTSTFHVDQTAQDAQSQGSLAKHVFETED